MEKIKNIFIRVVIDMYNPMIKKSKILKKMENIQTSSMPDLDYNELKGVKKNKIKDIRKVSNDSLNGYKDNIDEISKNKNIPIPGLLIEYDENPHGDWIPPHSDWVGPSGEAWLQL